MENTLATFNIQVIKQNGDETTVLRDDTDKRIIADLPAMLESVEEDLGDLLPDGYEVKITEWNQIGS